MSRPLFFHMVRHKADTQECTLRVTVLQQLFHNPDYCVSRNREAHTSESTGWTLDHRIHTDESATCIQQRTTAVPRVDRRICLDHAPDHVAVHPLHLTTEPANNSLRERLVEAEGISYRVDPPC